MSPLVQHLLLLPTLAISFALTIFLRAWMTTRILAGIALIAGILLSLGVVPPTVFTWITGSFFLVACANVILKAAGPPDSSGTHKTPPSPTR